MTRFIHTYCSQCDKDLGPGEDGVSSCAGHMDSVFRAVEHRPVAPYPISEEEVDTALRIAVHEGGCFTAYEVTGMRRALENHEANKLKEYHETRKDN